MNVLNKLTENIYTYPVRWSGLIRAIILCGTAFGLKLSADQVAAIMLLMEAILSTFTHQNVSPLLTLNKASNETNK